MADIYGEGSNSKRQWKKLKDAPMKEKARYIAMYYGIAIAATIGLIIFIVSLVRTIRYNKVPLVITVETYSSTLADDAADKVMEKIAPRLNVDPDDYHIEVTSNLADSGDIQQAYALSQKIFARIAAADLDCMIARESMMLSYMNKDDPGDRAFHDLRGFIPEDLYNLLLEEDRIVFLDAPDSDYPYGIDITGTDLYDTLGLIGEGHVLAFVITSENIDGQLAFADMIYE